MKNAEHTHNTKKFIILSLLLIIGRLYDATTTYLYTPDLKSESNVIVKFLGAGWISVMIFQLLLAGLVVYCLYYYLFKFKVIMPPGNKVTIKEFTSYLYFGNTNSFGKIFYRMPNNKNIMFASIGYMASMTLIFVSYLVGTSTLFLLVCDRYRELYKQGIPSVLYCIVILLAIYFSLRFYQVEYKKYKKSL